jgi:epoxyqueuosine reductase
MSSDPLLLKESIKAEANTLGFCIVGFSSPADCNIESYQSWINNKYHAGMTYLAKEEACLARQNPQFLFPQCKTIISLGAIYPNLSNIEDKPLPSNVGKIANYAHGLDYHLVLHDKIHQLMETLFPVSIENTNWTYAIDTKPYAERELAVNAGLGWIAKNSMLTNPKYGSALFLCEILLDKPIPPDAPFTQDYCGTCSRCIEACPTQCILENRTIDANRCLSYLTIEHRGIITEEYIDGMDTSIFGCDICLQVCPWNKKAKTEPRMYEFFPINGGTFDISEHIDQITTSFSRHFEKSAIKRAGKQGFLRNCLIRLAKDHNTENAVLSKIIVDRSTNSYLKDQMILIGDYLKKKKGS